MAMINPVNPVHPVEFSFFILAHAERKMKYTAPTMHNAAQR